MRRWPALLLAALPLTGCGEEPQTCTGKSFPAPPSDAGDLLFVDDSCPADLADGTREHPFPRIGDALTRASPGATILVAEESAYQEELVIDKPVRILAGPPETAAQDATTVVRPATGPGLVVSPGVTDVLVRGLVIERPKAAGIWIADGARATLDGVRVHAVELDGDGQYGYGILASGGASATLVRTAVDGAPSIGIYVKGAAASLDRVDVTGVTGHGGLRLEDTTDVVTVHDSMFSDCEEVGVLVAGSDAKLTGVTVTGVLLGKSGGGDGIVVTRRKGADGAYLGHASADIDASLVAYAARVGVLFAGGATGSLSGTTVGFCAPNATFGAGVWLQSGAGGEEGVLLSKNTIHSNTFLGVGLTSGATARIVDNFQISSTAAGLLLVGDQYFSVGDGLGVFNGARATVESNAISGNERMGAIFDGAAAGTTFHANEVTNNQSFGLLIQNPGDTIPPFAGNDFQNNGNGPTLVLGPSEPAHPVHTGDLSTP